ncbi:MAG: glycogen/starch/alpha-glucan phosphorylase, partial [Eubacteriales bacterium]
MPGRLTLQRELLVANMETELDNIAKQMFEKTFESCSDKESYYCVLFLTKSLADVTTPIAGKKKVYYISAEFLIGKLLSNNLINLGVYDKLSEILEAKGKSMAAIEEAEPEPSLGNGGLGRLAACFLDSIATLGLP